MQTSSPPHNDDELMDPDRRARAREHARERRRLALLQFVWSALLVLFFLQSGASVALRDLLRQIGLTDPWLQVTAYLTVALLAYSLLTLPMEWWSGYVVPHRYGLSTQTPYSWLQDLIKSLLLAWALGVLLGQVVYALLRINPDTWWAWAGIVLLLATIGLGQLAPVLILPLFYTLTPLEDDELCRRIRRLGEYAGIRVAEIYTIDLSRRTTTANALFLGLGRTRRIALGDTLYEDYDVDEIETIIAHEMGHQAHHDLEQGIAVQSALLFGGLYAAHLALRWGVSRYGFEGIHDLAALPLFLLVMGAFAAVTGPLINAHSRWREREADRYALRITQNPRAFARALRRLTRQNLVDLEPPQWVVWLTYTHPPIRERLAMAENWPDPHLDP
ncbi:MAG: M48 family metallopeptidase [Anaerolineae bacterium]